MKLVRVSRFEPPSVNGEDMEEMEEIQQRALSQQEIIRQHRLFPGETWTSLSRLLEDSLDFHIVAKVVFY